MRIEKKQKNLRNIIEVKKTTQYGKMGKLQSIEKSKYLNNRSTEYLTQRKGDRE